MPIVTILITLVVFGAVLYLINLIPMEAWIKQLIQVLAILLVVIWLLQTFGLVGPILVLR